MPRARLPRAANALKGVPPPVAPIYRIGRPPDPFEPPPWSLAGEDGAFGNRFDDPGKGLGLAEDRRFRMVYCATTSAAAFGETLARFRPSLSLLGQLAGIADDEPLDPRLFHEVVIPRDWRSRRRLGKTTLEEALRFVDLADPANLQTLRGALAPVASQLGLPDVDLSAVTGPHRRLTQHLARYVYEQADERGQPTFAGLRYVSRLNPHWECWAIFHDRLQHSPAMPAPILPDEPGLVQVRELFGFSVETLHGAIMER